MKSRNRPPTAGSLERAADKYHLLPPRPSVTSPADRSLSRDAQKAAWPCIAPARIGLFPPARRQRPYFASTPNERNPRFSRVGAPSVRSGSGKGPDSIPDSPPSTLGAGIMPGRIGCMDQLAPCPSSRAVHSGPQLLKTGGSIHRRPARRIDSHPTAAEDGLSGMRQTAGRPTGDAVDRLAHGVCRGRPV